MYRRGPRRSSLTTRSAQRSPITSSALATEQNSRYDFTAAAYRVTSVTAVRPSKEKVSLLGSAHGDRIDGCPLGSALAATSLVTEARARAGIAKVAGLGAEGVGIGA